MSIYSSILPRLPPPAAPPAAAHHPACCPPCVLPRTPPRPRCLTARHPFPRHLPPCHSTASPPRCPPPRATPLPAVSSSHCCAWARVPVVAPCTAARRVTA